MKENRPDPDRLLARLDEEGRAGRGRLKIFFGAAAGVGKTYAMLQEARAIRTEGIDVVAGWVETHGRSETQLLLEGLSLLPSRMVEHRGRSVPEFDLDAALARAPQVLLLDELAHSNAPGSRHEKRWQDLEELLAAGIDVRTTMNVQHLESVNDIVAQTTGVVVRETVPDRIFESADEIELVDLTPDDLLQRLREGKVYLPADAERAAQNFFNKGNLIALRELALRRAVERVDAQMRTYRVREGIRAVWPVRERILVLVSPSPAASRVVRVARRMAGGLSAEWIVATVEKPGTPVRGRENQARLAQTLRLAEQLGAEVVTLLGHSVSDEIVAYARSRNVTRIVLGKPQGHWWRYRLFGSVVEEVVRKSEEIEVTVVRGTEDRAPGQAEAFPLRPTSRPRAYLLSLPVVAVATLAASLLSRWLAPMNLAMLYLVGIAFVAVRLGRGPSILASILSVLTFNFFCVPPLYTLSVWDSQYILTFGVMLVVGTLIGTLAGRLRSQAQSSRVREQRIAALYGLSKEFSRTSGVEAVVRLAEQVIGDLLGAEVWILLPGPGGPLAPAPGITSVFTLGSAEMAVAQWVFDHGTMAGRGTSTLPGSQGLFLPLTTSRGTIGVLGLFLSDTSAPDPDRMHLAEALAGQTALVVERSLLAREAQRAELQKEADRLRDALLSSVSHDLRTPLGTITGAASSLADPEAPISEEGRRELAQAIREESERMNRLVGNLLNMTRLQSGALGLNKEWHPVDEVVGAALTRLRRMLRDRPVTIRLDEDLPLVRLDDVLIEQVLVNLIENTVRHTPEGTPVEIAAWVQEEQMVIEVADRGAGLPPGWEDRLFDRFARPESERSSPGVGLGLAVCKGFVEAHGGWIRAENRPEGGASFCFGLPLEEEPPLLPPEEEEEEEEEEEGEPGSPGGDSP